MNRAHLTILGCGASLGVPVVGCSCAVCTSKDPKNRRGRPAALLKVGHKRFLIDVGPDIHNQLLQTPIDHLDGLILTHTHYDHIAGLDELRVFYFKNEKPVSVLLSDKSYEELKKRYFYLIDSPRYQCQVLEKDRGSVQFGGLDIDYISYDQLGMSVNGFCFGKLAYITDLQQSTDAIIADLKGTEILVLNALKWGASRAHLSVEEALDLAELVSAKMTYLIHLSHDLDYKKTNQRLPSNVQLAYDGLTIPFQL